MNLFERSYILFNFLLWLQFDVENKPECKLEEIKFLLTIILYIWQLNRSRTVVIVAMPLDSAGSSVHLDGRISPIPLTLTRYSPTNQNRKVCLLGVCRNNADIARVLFWEILQYIIIFCVYVTEPMKLGKDHVFEVVSTIKYSIFQLVWNEIWELRTYFWYLRKLYVSHYLSIEYLGFYYL
jgi:hypothetical protein